VLHNKVDRKAPTVTITRPTASAYLFRQSVLAEYSCEDGAGSGLAATDGCKGTVANGGAIDTATVGSKTFRVTAVDAVGNTSGPRTVTYQVNYDWSGFFQPIDMGMLNTAKAGSAIPVKFKLGGYAGMAIFSKTPTATKIACPSESQAPVEEVATTSTSGLQWDATAQQYVYVWKTVATYAGTCQRLSVELSDGTTARVADFKFAK
jgi:hypothetical protein